MGAVGTALALSAHNAGIQICQISSRTDASIENLPGALQDKFVKLSELNNITSDILFIAVKDDALNEVALQLSKQVDIQSSIVAHCSGVLTSDTLQHLVNDRVSVASFHPIQSFTGKSVFPFKEIYIDIEADNVSYTKLEEISAFLGAYALRVTKEQKALLHLAASIASNFLVGLIQSSVDAGSMKGGDKANVLKALLPLIRDTINNIDEVGTHRALTGPIVRGDSETVHEHMKLLKHEKYLSDLYKLLGEKILHISLESERITETTAEEIYKRLYHVE